MPAVAFYISGHGFGHASRSMEIVNALRAAAPPDLSVILCTDVPAWVLEHGLTAPATVRPVICDTGLRQLDSLHADEAASIRVAADFHASLDRRRDEEVAALSSRGVRVVVGDIPPLACEVAGALGVPSVAIGNFTWDWIYEGFPEHLAAHPDLVPTIQQAYRRASHALRLPMHGGFDSMRQVLRDVPLVARRAGRSRSEVRQRLALPEGEPLVLLSFGGYGLQGVDQNGLSQIRGYTLVITDDRSGQDLWGHTGSSPEVSGGSLRVASVSRERLERSGCRYPDLVHAVDVVVTKPGYGIVSECIANDTAVLYTSRGRFPEYPVLVEGLQQLARSQFIPQDELLAGHWQPYLDRLLSMPGVAERPALDGAVVAARLILDVLEHAGG